LIEPVVKQFQRKPLIPILVAAGIIILVIVAYRRRKKKIV